MGRGAPGRQPGRGGPGELGHAGQGRCGGDGGRRRLPPPHAPLRHHAAIDIWYDSTQVERFIDFFEPADRGQVKMQIEKGKEKRTSRGAFAKLTTDGAGRPRITAQPPLRVTHRRRGARRHRRPPAGRLPVDPPRGPPDAVRPLHPGRRGPPGGGGGQRRHGGVPRALRGQRPAPTRSSCSSSRPGPRSTRRTPTRASTTTTATGSSPANGWCRARPTSSSAGARWPAVTSTSASTAT